MVPVTAGSLIQRSFEVFRAGFVPFFILAFIFYLPIAVLQLTVLEPEDPDLSMTLVSGQGFALMLAYVLVIPIASAAVVFGVFMGLRGRPATISQCIALVWLRGPAILGLAILTVLVVGTGYLLFVIPGMILTYGLFVAGPVLIVEKTHPIEAMKRSWQLTDGYKPVLFFLALAIGMLQLTITIATNLAFGIDALGREALPTGLGLYQVLSSLVVVVFIALKAVAAGVAYHDLRSLREGSSEDEVVAVIE